MPAPHAPGKQVLRWLHQRMGQWSQKVRSPWSFQVWYAPGCWSFQYPGNREMLLMGLQPCHISLCPLPPQRDPAPPPPTPSPSQISHESCPPKPPRCQCLKTSSTVALQSTSDPILPFLSLISFHWWKLWSCGYCGSRNQINWSGRFLWLHDYPETFYIQNTKMEPI